MVIFLTNSVIKKWPEDLANISGPNCWSTPYWIFNSRFFSNNICVSLKRTLFLNRTSAAFTILSTLYDWKMRPLLCLKHANFGWRGLSFFVDGMCTYNHYICLLPNGVHSEKLWKTRWYKYPLSPNHCTVLTSDSHISASNHDKNTILSLF